MDEESATCKPLLAAEKGTTELSLGKYVFDSKRQNWMSMPGDPQYIHQKAFKSSIRETRDEELDAAIGLGSNYLRDDIATLRFTFQLPLEVFKLAVADPELATHVCKVTFAVPP